jgi:hypothetical protein
MRGGNLRKFEEKSMNYETIAVELVRALRGRRSLAELSRKAGYRSNAAHRWESRRSWPTMARVLDLHRRLHPRAAPRVLGFASEQIGLRAMPRSSVEEVAAFLREIKGKTSINHIAEAGGFSRFSVTRWLKGSAEPKLPEFLCLVEVCSRRLLDLLALFVDPGLLPSVAESWNRLRLAQQSAYEHPWSHAVLRALELEGKPTGVANQVKWISERLGIAEAIAAQALAVLTQSGQVTQKRGQFVPTKVMFVNTGSDAQRARQLRLGWARTAVERLESGAPGYFGYSLFSISKQDMVRVRDLHSQYLRAIQDVIARSSPSECVGLYSIQLLDLASPMAESPR